MKNPFASSVHSEQNREGKAACENQNEKVIGFHFSFPECGTKDTLSNVAVQSRFLDTGIMKRTVQVNVKMTEEDFKMLQKAAEKRWPDAVMTNSGIVLALARIAARDTLGKVK
jgi:hypothetical protein